MRTSLIAPLAFFWCASALADPLPPEAQRLITELAAQADVLILGEIHGTKEVPAIAEELLDPLTKRGYGALALEVPREQQAALTAWATGHSQMVPGFFAKPTSDGRGSIEALQLIRTALSPPYRWKLICFDGPVDEMLRELKRAGADGTAEADPADPLRISITRDAGMALTLSSRLQALAPRRPKVLAICGGLHARTANHARGDDLLVRLWPSFAAVLQHDHDVGQVRSVNIAPHSGSFFNGGKVNRLGGRPIDRTEARLTPVADYDLGLDLPVATAATYLSPPSDDMLRSQAGAPPTTVATAPRTPPRQCRFVRCRCRRRCNWCGR